MKQIILLISLLTTGFIIQAQNINNGGFETWGTGDPDGWQSPNSMTSGFGVTTVSKEVTDVYSGLNSAKLETKSVFGAAVPGILTNGTIKVNLSSNPPVSVIGGAPFSLIQMPVYFTGYYKYVPVSGDACEMTALLLKRKSSTVVDTVAYARFTSSTNISTWTKFSALFIYKGGGTVITFPDTIQIAIISSNPTMAKIGSVLKVDNIDIEFGTHGINNVNLFKNINISPNPASEIINIQFNQITKTQTTISIYSLIGQRVKETILPIGTELSSINVRSLNKGIYFIHVQSGKDMFTQKISIE